MYGVQVPSHLLSDEDVELLGVQQEMQTNGEDYPADLSDAMLERIRMTEELYAAATVAEVRLAVDDAVSALKLDVNSKMPSPFERFGHMHLSIVPDDIYDGSQASGGEVYLGVGIFILDQLVDEEDGDKLLNAVLELRQAGAKYWTWVT